MLKIRAHSRKARKSSRGFTLVEALISLVIIAIAAAGILGSFVAAKQFIEHSGRRQISANLVRQEMERLLATAVREDPPSSAALAITDGNNNNCADVGDWTVWVSVPGLAAWGGQSRRCVSVPPGSGYRKVTTQIQWRAAN